MTKKIVTGLAFVWAFVLVGVIVTVQTNPNMFTTKKTVYNMQLQPQNKVETAVLLPVDVSVGSKKEVGANLSKAGVAQQKRATRTPARTPTCIRRELEQGSGFVTFCE